MALTLALAGDTMLGRGVARRLRDDPSAALLAPEVVSAAASADCFVLNLECCISDRGVPFPDPHKPFFFRAPPVAAERLAEIGVRAVTLANNHALDFGPVALLDTLDHLAAAGVTAVGAGPDQPSARAPAVLAAGGLRLRLVAVTDHPAEYAAGHAEPGVAYADLYAGRLPPWLEQAAQPGGDVDLALVAPHWGPNMRDAPVPHVRHAAEELVAAGATAVAGHSAHVPQGVAGRVLYDLGDFVDDYAVHRELRNDLGLLWLLTVDRDGPRRLDALPLRLEIGFTRLATGDDAAWMRHALSERCRRLGTEVSVEDGRLVVTW